MENGRQNGKRSSPTFLSEAVTSSSFLFSFQGMFHPGYADVPFVGKRVLIHDIPESNEANRIRQTHSELLSSLTAKKLFQVGRQHPTRAGKSWALACEGGRFGGQKEDIKLSVPFLVHTESTECNSAFSRDYSKEIITFDSAAQAVSNKDKKEYKFERAIVKQPEKRDKLSQESIAKKKKEDALEDDHTSNGPRERENYWERRKKNNASAKKSRDARKTRELQTQIKAAFLERENLRIHAQLMIAQQENTCLKRVLCAKM